MATKKPFKRARNTFSDVLKGYTPNGNAKPTILKKKDPKMIKSIFRYDQKIDMSQKKTTETIIPSFLDYEFGKIDIFYRGYTSEDSVEHNSQPEADEPSNVDQEPPKPLVSEQRRGTVGMKRPPASSIAIAESRKAEIHKATIDEPIQKKSLGQNLVPKNHGKNISENIGNYDANNSTEKKYKKIIIPSTPVSEDSYGYNTPTELEIMAERARNNQITET
ncbi:hypothetical protein AYI69_g8812, partial [Smittium culicis]